MTALLGQVPKSAVVYVGRRRTTGETTRAVVLIDHETARHALLEVDWDSLGTSRLANGHPVPKWNVARCRKRLTVHEARKKSA